MKPIAFVALFAFLAGCERPADPLTTSPELRPPDPAKVIKKQRAEGFERVDYTVVVPHPATSFIREIAERAEQRGWKPLRENYFNQGDYSSYIEGWQKYVAGGFGRKPKRHVYVRWAQWLRPDGTVLDYVFTYEYALNSEPNLSNLYVGAAIMSPERARQIGAKPPTQPAFVQPGTPPNTTDVLETLSR